MDESSSVKGGKKPRNAGGPGQHSDKELKALMLNRSEQTRLSTFISQVSKDEKIYDKNHKAAQRNVIINSNRRLERRKIPTLSLRSQSTSDLFDRTQSKIFPLTDGALDSQDNFDGERVFVRRKREVQSGKIRSAPPTTASRLRSQSMDNMLYQPKLSRSKMSPWGLETPHRSHLGFEPKGTLSAATLSHCKSANPPETVERRVESFIQRQLEVNELNPIPPSVKERTERSHQMNCVSQRRISLTLTHSQLVLETLKRLGLNPHTYRVK